MNLCDRLGLEHPVVQAGMGGGVATGALAGAVSAAGALGTVGIMGPAAFGAAIRDARRRAPGRPVAANLLGPFTKRGHVQACLAERPDLVVLHGGADPQVVGRLRAGGLLVFDTVGTPAAAQAALRAGVDGLVVQGKEAGGHTVGEQPAVAAVAAVRAAVGDKVPLLGAGGVAEAGDVRRLLDAGADAAVAGTRFLLTDESQAHPEYQRRVRGATDTFETLLFGFGWPMRHRVVPNAATRRWCGGEDQRGPDWVRRVEARSGPVGRLLPVSLLGRMVPLQRLSTPIFTPALPLAGMPASSVDRTALYAGETAARVTDVIPAAEAVARLVS
ncbi:MAG: 2-nitropropane dioxygenase [Solirubrobacterales bacterium]|nr:2-nitropropane dioxygenase [Solirubrobacterales bacterium]